MIMNNDASSSDQLDAKLVAERSVWVRPVLTQIQAGSAENGAGQRADDAINFS